MPTLNLHPRTAAELLDQAVRLYRRYFLKFTGIVALASLPYAVLQAIGSGLSLLPLAFSFDSPRTLSGLASLGFMGSFAMQAAGGLLYFVLVQGVATACLTQAIKDDALGQPVGIINSLKRLKSCLGDLAIALILAYALLTFGGLLILIPCVGWFFGLGVVIFFSAAVFQVLVPVVVFEQHRSITTSLRRAWELTRQRFWAILRYYLVLGLFQQVLMAGPIILLAGTFFWVINNLTPSPEAFTALLGGQVVFQSLLAMFTSVLWVPLQVAAVNMLYLDLRVRADGLDLAWQAARLTQHTPAEVLAHGAVTKGPWLRLEDRRNFILLSLLVFVAIIGLLVLYFGLLFLLIGASRL